jgi:Ca2+/Na+ antiporter
MGGIAKVVGSVLFGLFGLVALYFAAHAKDGGIFYAGMLIFALSVIYIFWQVKRAMDEQDRRHHGGNDESHA